MRLLSFFIIPIILAALLAALITPTAHALSPLDAESMEARVTIMNTVRMERTGSYYKVNEVSGTLTWYPRENWLQDTTRVTIDPAGRQDGESIVFTWSDPLPAQTLRVTDVVTTRSAFVPVRERVPFPLTDVPAEMDQYLGQGEIIDTSPEIQALAAQLAAGKTDAYEVVFALADWTNTNINYSLASVGQPASQKASAVLESRYGKCDELTALFISMNRALGIPARFAAGYAYTNSPLFKTEWGGHGWAEVWLPGQGWVPFDTTYGQYGYLDAGHITLKTAADAKETSIDYYAQGTDFRLVTEPLDITITPLELRERVNDEVTVTLSTPYESVGFGSTALILASVRNNKDYYVSTRLDLGKTTNSDTLTNSTKAILLKPRETRTVPFLVRINDGLQQGYRYEFPFRMRTRMGNDASIMINVRQDAPTFSESAYTEELERYAESGTQAPAVIVTCEQQGARYVGQDVTHGCVARGVRAQALEICSQRNCTKVALDEGRFTLITRDDRAGVHTRTYTVKHNGQTARFYVRSRSVEPAVIIANLTGPRTATPDDAITATLSLSHTGALPKDVNIMMRAHNSQSVQALADLSRPASISFTLPGRALRPGENTLVATITSVDELGTAVNQTAQATIVLEGVGWLDRVQFALEDAGQWLIDLF